MGNVFIGWSGNKTLADNLATVINNNSQNKAIVGGGTPKDMFIGAQVLGQIDKSNFAVLLVEKKQDGNVSSNLMFEWGYIMAKMGTNNVSVVLLNMTSRDLPSDLLGTWVHEIAYDPSNYSEMDLANQVYNTVKYNIIDNVKKDYFSIINNWNQIFAQMKETQPDSDQEFAENIIVGCLAAYYYMDNVPLRKFLDTVHGNAEVNQVVTFSKAYIDLFIQSANMTEPLKQDDFFNLIQVYEETLLSEKTEFEELDLLLDILCYDAYGLACLLYLKSKDMDEETQSLLFDKAIASCHKALELVEVLSTKSNSECLIQLLKSYMYNDIAHLYKDFSTDNSKFLENLELSVNFRKALYQTFTVKYPNNMLLYTKFEQEYVIALSEQCNYITDPFMKNMYKKKVITKFTEWQKDLIYTSSLTDRIQANIKNIT